MKPSLPIETIKERLSIQRLFLDQEYLGNTNLKHSLICDNGHRYIAYLQSAMKHRCKRCARVVSLDVFLKKLSNITGYKLVGQYVNMSTDTTFECPEKHTFVMSPNKLINKNLRCRQCSIARSRLTLSDINEKIQHRGISLVGEYLGNALSKQTFRCEIGHEWIAELSSVMRDASCPECSVSGFKKEKSAHVYLLKFDSFIKYGISNRLNIRLSEHKSNGEYEVVITRFFENGKEAFLLEKTIKQYFGGSCVTKDMCQDGYTETLSLELLEEVKTFIINHSISTK